MRCFVSLSSLTLSQCLSLTESAQRIVFFSLSLSLSFYIQREREKVVLVGGKAPGRLVASGWSAMTTRAAQKKAARKARMEKIMFGRREDGDEGLVGIPRFKLTPAHVNNVFRCEVEYCVDEQGIVTYPERFMWECMPPPFKYFVVEKEPVVLPPDDAVDLYYFGETQIVLWNVPISVTASALRCFIEKGLERTDDKYITLEAELLAIREKKTRNQERLDNVPYMVVEAKSEQGEAEERRQINKRLELEKRQLEEQEATIEKAFAKENKRRESSALKLEQWSRDEKRKLSSWYVNFDRAGDARRCVTFEEWSGVKLALGYKTKKETVGPKAYFGEEVEADRIEDEVVMRGVVFQRLRHGHGTYTDWDFGDCYQGEFKHGKRDGPGKVYDRLGVYHGTFANDFRNGQGVQVFANAERYEGEHSYNLNHLREAKLLGDDFLMGIPNGKGGRYEFADGAVYEGEFKDGVISGKGVYSNPKTGERMEGTFVCGRLHGRGLHITRTGEKLEGMFKDGLLDGTGSWESKPRKPPPPPPQDEFAHLAGLGDEDLAAASTREMLELYKQERDREEAERAKEEELRNQETSKVDDLLAGHTPLVFSKPRDRNRCVGTFSNGRPHGKCLYEYRKGHTYHGFYMDGERSGPGSMLYGNVRETFDKTTGKTQLKHDFAYTGLWLADRIRVQGCHITVRDRLLPSEKMSILESKKNAGYTTEERDSFTYTTNFRSWQQYPFLHKMVFKQDARSRRAFSNALKWEKRNKKERAALLTTNYKDFREKRRAAIRIYKRIDRQLAAFDDDQALDEKPAYDEIDEDEDEESYYDDESYDESSGEEEVDENQNQHSQYGYYDSDWDSVGSGVHIEDDNPTKERIFIQTHPQYKELQVSLVDVFENPPPKDAKTGHTSIPGAIEHYHLYAQRSKYGLR